jgi:hypothetical protein
MHDSTSQSQFNRSLATLRQFVRQRTPVERCELCGAEIPADHSHLVDPESRRITCSCDACAILFPNQGDAKYRRIPREARALPEFHLSDAQWDSLLIPINMAFFYESTPAERVVAMYPSPAGATESLLSFETWSEIVRDNPVLRTMQPDTEAFLANRLGQRYGYAGSEYYIAPIDQCYKLVGLIRAHWRGLSGGTEAWEQIRRFFDHLREFSRPVCEPSHA